MNNIAKSALSRLVDMADRAWGRGAADAKVSLRMSEASFPVYAAMGSHRTRQECHGELQLVEQSGGISIEWDERAGDRRQISRLELLNCDVVAAAIGRVPLKILVEEARNGLDEFIGAFPVLSDVLARWRDGAQVRSTKVTDWRTWRDAAVVILRCRASGGDDLPIRRLSTALFSDSKRLENVWPAMDVLMQGDASSQARPDEEVFGELGLVKFAPTLLVAGDGVVEVASGQRTELLRPYLGVPPASVVGFSGLDSCRVVLSVENLTTFHELSSSAVTGDGCVLIYSAGMPSPSWLRVYALLLNAAPSTAIAAHWGDMDTGGFRIAQHVAKQAQRHGRRLVLHGMDGSLCGGADDRGAPIGDVVRRPLRQSEVAAIVSICAKWGWQDEADWIGKSGHAVEQESMVLALP